MSESDAVFDADEYASDLNLLAVHDHGRDMYRHPRVGDMFRFGALWVIIDRVTVAAVTLRMIDPVVGSERTGSASVPLPAALVPVRDSAY